MRSTVKLSDVSSFSFSSLCIPGELPGLSETVTHLELPSSGRVHVSAPESGSYSNFSFPRKSVGKYANFVCLPAKFIPR